MYKEFFGIVEDPFAITPDPKFLYLSERHREALAHLVFGVTEGGGFVQLTGEVGTGKTMLCRNLLMQLPDELNIALIFNPRQTPLELVASLCDELHVEYPKGTESIKVLVDCLNTYLLENHRAGRRTVVIIDEAQNLSFEALEQIRLLTNLETATQKLLEIILVGQPELQSLLSQPELRQLSQRITARYHLTPLTAKETRAYVIHRLNVAGYQRRLFTPGALRLLHKLTGGVPRLINVICGRAMLAAYGRHVETINRWMLRKVAMEVQGKPAGVSWKRPLAWGVSMLLFVAVGLYGWRSMDDLVLLADLKNTTIDSQIPESQPVTPIQKISPSRPALVPPPEAPDPVPAVATVEVQPLSVEAGEPAPSEPDSENVEPSQVAAPPEIVLDANELESFDSVAEEIVRELGPTPPLAGMLDDVSNAFSTLFGYWQAVYPMAGNGSACEKAEKIGLKCIFGRGSWNNLEFYNRPAVIEFLLDNGKRYHVVVSALDDGLVTLDLGQKRVTLPRIEVESLWTGSYIVLWRPPNLGSPLLSMGSRGRDVSKLIDMLDRAEGRPSTNPNKLANAVYDWSLKQRVIDFQRSMGLTADGIVGKQTLLKLNAAQQDPSTPLLMRDRG
jgi:general secretion pathway protein A